MADYLIHDSTLEDIADAIRAKTGGSALINPEDMADAIDSIQTGGGVEIADGIVVKARDADGRATNVDFYGDTVHINQFYCRTVTEGQWFAMVTINFINEVTEIKDNAFMCCASLENIDFSSLESLGAAAFQSCTSLLTANLPNLISIKGNAFINCTSLKTANAPLLKNLGQNNIFRGCTALETVQLGSVGNGVTSVAGGCFNQDTQQGLTVTIYTTSSYVDSVVSNTRNGATNATIIIKASENTTYNNVSYNAGDTILTSEVTS